MTWLVPVITAAQVPLSEGSGESTRPQAGGVLAPEFLALPQFQPLFTAAEFQLATERMRFDDDTTSALFSHFYDEYRQAFDASLGHTLARLSDIEVRRRAWRAENPDRPYREPDFGRQEVWNTWMARRDELETRLAERIDALLDPARHEQWRQIRRDVRLRAFAEHRNMHRIPWSFEPRAVFEAIGIDVDVSGAELTLPAQAWMDGYAEAVEQYQQARADNDAWWAHPASQEMSRRDPALHQKESNERHYRVVDLMYAIRDAAGRVEPVVRALSPEQGRRFVEEVERRRHPGVYAPSPIDLLSEQLAAAELPAPVRENVDAIMASALARQEQIRRRMVRGIETYEAPTPRRARLKALAEAADHVELEALRAHHAAEHPALPIWREYRDHVHATCRQVRLAMPADVLDGLPSAVRLLVLWAE